MKKSTEYIPGAYVVRRVVKQPRKRRQLPLVLERLQGNIDDKLTNNEELATRMNSKRVPTREYGTESEQRQAQSSVLKALSGQPIVEIHYDPEIPPRSRDPQEYNHMFACFYVVQECAISFHQEGDNYFLQSNFVLTVPGRSTLSSFLEQEYASSALRRDGSRIYYGLNRVRLKRGPIMAIRCPFDVVKYLGPAAMAEQRQRRKGGKNTFSLKPLFTNQDFNDAVYARLLKTFDRFREPLFNQYQPEKQGLGNAFQGLL